MKLVIPILLCLSSCAPLIIGTGALIGGKMMVQEKTVGEAVSDKTVWTKVNAALLSLKLPASDSVTVSVHEGIVLLTGHVTKSKDLDSIVEIVWKQGGVRSVINEVVIGNASRDPSLKGNYMSDSWITTKIRTRLLTNRQVRSVNFKIETVRGVVYVFGLAQNEAEKELVLKEIHEITGVVEVRPYIRIKGKAADSYLYEDSSDVGKELGTMDQEVHDAE